jgi:ABC-2 type transport system permease protein
MCLNEKGYFGLSDLAGQYLLRALTLWMLLGVWRALFRSHAEIDGLTLSGMLAYTVLSSALDPLLNVHTPASSWLHDGTMLSLYLRPASIFGQLIAHTVGGMLMPLMLYTVPVLIVAPFMGISLWPATPWFFLSVVLCVSQGFAVDFLFACLMIRLRTMQWTMARIREALNALLTGALIPFAALPWGMGFWFSLSPLGTLAGAPLALSVGLADARTIIGAQLFWNAVLWPLALYLFGRSRERMVSYGG